MTAIFIADLHLCSQRPALIDAFVHFTEKTVKGCEALYLLGDIFEAWIGDDYHDPALQPAIDALKKLSRNGTELFFQHGNRDFLVGQNLMLEIGATLLDETHLVDVGSQTALIMHGDQLCTDDTEYQKFRSLVRSDIWRTDFLNKPVAQRLQIADHLRAQSKEHSSQKSQEITDVNPQAVIQALIVAKVQLLIHGHTHRPNIHEIETLNAKNAKRMVLGDWGESLWYIKSDENGCHLIEENIL